MLTLRRSLITIFAFLAATLLVAAPASAETTTFVIPKSTPSAPPTWLEENKSAIGSAAIGSFTYSPRGVSINVPVGCYLTHSVTGYGKNLDRQRAGVDCAGPAALRPSLFCNYKFVFFFKDDKGKSYGTYATPVQNKCDTITPAFDNPNLPATLPAYGQACARFYTLDVKRAEVCHNIHAG